MTAIAIFGLLTITSAQAPSYVPTSGLVGYWSFNGNANDESGNGNNGIVYGATLTSDKSGKTNAAYFFDGLNDRIEFSDRNFSNVKFSISIWVNSQSSSSNGGAVIGKTNWSDAQAEGFGFGVSPTELYYSVKGLSCVPGQGWNGNKSVKGRDFDNNWKHVVLVFDGISKYLYVDKVLINKSTIQNSAVNCPGGQIRLGAWWQNDPIWFKGSIDDLGIWNRVLTEEEIESLNKSTNEISNVVNSNLLSWKYSQGSFNKTDKRSVNGLPIWQENNGQFQYEETSSSIYEAVLRDLNRQGVYIKLTNDRCYYKDNGLTDYRLLYSGAWEVKTGVSGDSETFYKKGLTNYEAKNYTQALSDFTSAIELNINYRDAYWSRGYLYRTIGNHQAFLNDFKKVIELDPNTNINAFLLIASSKLKLGDSDAALVDVNKVINVNPNLWEAHYTKARILFVKKDYAGCILSADNVLKISPNDEHAYLLKAMSEGSLGQIEKSCVSFNKAISLGNDFAKQLYNDNKLSNYCIGNNKSSSEIKNLYEQTLYNLFTMDFTSSQSSSNKSSSESQSSSTQTNSNQPLQFVYICTAGKSEECCKAVVITSGSPTLSGCCPRADGKGCSMGHWWNKCGQSGDRNFQCSYCGISVRTTQQPNNMCCPINNCGGGHNWHEIK